MSGPTRISTPDALQAWSDAARGEGLSIGLVPTMGALHAGHVSLIRRARAECDRVIVSIFVNPTQFGPGEDFADYPRSMGHDLVTCAEEGADVVFTPSVAALYPAGAVSTLSVGPPLTTTLEAESRPGHFDGVATVVNKLFTAALPHRAYFGQKDAQQCAVIAHLIHSLGLDVELVICPVVRDPDGLALSSRNAYLSAEEREQALAIPAALAAAARLFASGETDATALADVARTELAAAPDLAPDYVALVDPETFEQVSVARVRCEILIAARIGGTRLIDALRLGVEEPPVLAGPRSRSEGSRRE